MAIPIRASAGPHRIDKRASREHFGRVDLFPADLALASALAWAGIFLAALPAVRLRVALFERAFAGVAVGWLLVALLAPVAIVHYYIFIALACAYGWRRLRRDYPFSAKLWLGLSSAVGASAGLVLILAVTPDAFPVRVATQIWFFVSVVLDGATAGLAAVLILFTRRTVTQAGFPVRTLFGYERLLVWLTFLTGFVRCINWPEVWRSHWAPAGASGFMAWSIFVIGLPVLGWVAGRRVRSPAPSRAGAPLLVFCVAALIAAILAKI